MMSATPPPMPGSSATANAGDPSRIAANVRAVLAVVQTEGHFRRVPEPFDRLRPLYMREISSAKRISPSQLAVTMQFGFVADVHREDLLKEPLRPSTRPEDRRAEAYATFVAVYQISPETEGTELELEAFARINGQLTLRPFWRAYLADALGRAGLPQLMAPVQTILPSNSGG